VSGIPSAPLSDGRSIPRLGFGVFQIPADRTSQAVSTALEAGYRLIDTAAIYGNEVAVGAAVASSGLPREEIFVTTKLWNSEQGYDAALRGFEAGRDRLGLEYLDLYLIHWPCPDRNRYVDTWRALCRLRETGVVRSIGVSNFQVPHLRRCFDATGVWPSVNQIELHPLLSQRSLRDFHDEHDIVTEAWSPLAKGQLMSDPTITEIARGIGRTPAQVVLRWHLRLGNVVIPKSRTPERIVSNTQVFDFELDDEDMTAIGKLDVGRRIGPDPDSFGA
jgi:2,5-diketo-D-gluconate reductase A